MGINVSDVMKSVSARVKSKIENSRCNIPARVVAGVVSGLVALRFGRPYGLAMVLASLRLIEDSEREAEEVHCQETDEQKQYGHSSDDIVDAEAVQH